MQATAECRTTRHTDASEGTRENDDSVRIGHRVSAHEARKIYFRVCAIHSVSISSTGFPHAHVVCRDAQPLDAAGMRHYADYADEMVWRCSSRCRLPMSAHAQNARRSIACFCSTAPRWRATASGRGSTDRLVFSMPVTPGDRSRQLHLVSIRGRARRLAAHRTIRQRRARRRDTAHSRGEADFARLSADVARRPQPGRARRRIRPSGCVAAERARRSLADWPAAHYGYRAREVHEIVGVARRSDSRLARVGRLGRYDLALTATTPPPPDETLLAGPDHGEVVQQLMTAATLVDTPAEKVSLLQTVVGVLDRAVGLLPEAWAATIRSTALGSIAEEQRIDGAYARLARRTLTVAARLRGAAPTCAASSGCAASSQEQDDKLGTPASGDVMAHRRHHRSPPRRGASAAARAGSVAAARSALRAPISARPARCRSAAHTRAAAARDIRALAGPHPWRLRPLVDDLAREARILVAHRSARRALARFTRCFAAPASWRSTPRACGSMRSKPPTSSSRSRPRLPRRAR